MRQFTFGELVAYFPVAFDRSMDSRISSRAPMHVEIATYVATPTAPAEAVAVAAVSGANESVDVYAIKVSCATDDPQIVREHVTLNSQ